MRPEHIEDILVHLHLGQWFGWRDGIKDYAHLTIHRSVETPTEEFLEAELASQQEAWDTSLAEAAENKESAKAKLAALGLSEEEISAAFGI